MLESAFARLSPEHRAVVVLHFYRDLSPLRSARSSRCPWARLTRAALRHACACAPPSRRTPDRPGCRRGRTAWTQPRDPDDAIRSWLADKPEQAPERAVPGHHRSTARHQPTSNVCARRCRMPLAAGVAALLVVALTLGLLGEPWPSNPSGATPSPSPSPSPPAACSVEIAVSGASPLIVGPGLQARHRRPPRDRRATAAMSLSGRPTSPGSIPTTRAASA
jgi:hypothetical protein